MADALISPVVGGMMLAATAGVTAYAIKKVQYSLDQKKIPLMGVMGALVFASQMINFSIPGTGSSGHLGGGLLLSIILGSYAGFLTMASILTIQALFFADGGLLALGCNIFNMGFYTCFIAYPFIFKKIVGKDFSKKKLVSASLITATVGLQLGAFGVVLETLFSGKTELPFGTFVLLMQPIHLAIGIVEGLVTASVAVFVLKERPEIIKNAGLNEPVGSISIQKILISFLVAAFIAGGIFSWFASSHPDGLEWSMFKTSGNEELETKNKIHKVLSKIQENTAFLPDYGFKMTASDSENASTEEAWPSVSAGTTVSGILGAALTLILAVLTAFTISLFKKRKKIIIIQCHK